MLGTDKDLNRDLWYTEDYQHDPQIRSLIKKNGVAGLAQQLPFRDESFDESIASFSLYWIGTGLNDALAEMYRVTKTGGSVKIHPVYTPRELDILKNYDELPLGAKIVHMPSHSPTLIIPKDASYSQDQITSGFQQLLTRVAFTLNPKVDQKRQELAQTTAPDKTE